MSDEKLSKIQTKLDDFILQTQEDRASIISFIRELSLEKSGFGLELRNLRDTIASLAHSLNHHQINNFSPSIECQLNWERYKGFDAPLYILEDGRLSLSNQAFDEYEKAAVISIPKSGTYLISAVLEKIGLVNTGVHVWEAGFHDYRGKTIPDMIHRYSEFVVNASLDMVVPLILPGQYVVGHLALNTKNQNILSSFKRIISIREMRHALISHMRFLENEGRGLARNPQWKEVKNTKARMQAYLETYGSDLIEIAGRVAKWLSDPESLIIRFEEITGDNGEDVAINNILKMASHVGISISFDKAKEIFTSVLNKPTLTWSGKRSSLEKYWSSESEAIFLENNGGELNNILGYD